jgi:UDP:flavonoid glycosyltransferase YjiC (YdhE family)
VKVAVFGYTGGLGHAGRMAAVARALCDRGHEVRVFGNPARLAPFALGGATVRAHPEPTWAAVRAMDARADLAWFLRGLLEDREALRVFAPDVVVTDNRRSTGPAAEAERVPWVALTSAALLGPHCGFAPTYGELALVASAFGATPFALLERGIALGGGPDTPVPLRAAPLPAEFVRALSAIGAAARTFVHELDLGGVALALDLPGVLPVEAPPVGVRTVRPILPEVQGELPTLAEGYTLVALGGTGAPGLREDVAAALVARGHRVVVAGDGVDVPGAQTVGLVSSAIFAGAARVVCHGGLTTLYRCVASGVPFIAMPAHPEQAINALAFARAGLGVACAPGGVSRHPEVLDDALGRVDTCGRMPWPGEGLEDTARIIEEMVS